MVKVIPFRLIDVEQRTSVAVETIPVFEPGRQANEKKHSQLTRLLVAALLTAIGMNASNGPGNCKSTL